MMPLRYHGERGAEMELLDELADAYLDNSFEHRYYLDLGTGQVVIDRDESCTGERGIDWRMK